MELEQEARTLGWVPQEDFKGNTEKWVDAETWVERGKHVMPILQKDREKLMVKVADQDSKIARLESLVLAGQEALGAMEEFHTEQTKRQVDKARKDILEGLKTAKRDGDVDAEVDLTDALSTIDAGIQAAAVDAAKPKPQVAQAAAHEADPEFLAWRRDNTWFETDRVKTAAAIGVGEELRHQGNRDTGRAFYDAVSAEVDRRFGGNKPPVSKVEGSQGGSGRTSEGKSFADLPPDAKEACDKYIPKVVGEGRRHKDAASWRKAYATEYFKGA